MQQNINVKIDIEINEQNITAVTTFNNISTKSVFLDKFNIFHDSTMKNNTFVIQQDEKKVPYQGPLVKRKLSENDFVEVKAGTSITTKVTISDYYKLVPATEYEIYYKAFHQYPIEKNLVCLTSPKVTFTTQRQIENT